MNNTHKDPLGPIQREVAVPQHPPRIECGRMTYAQLIFWIVYLALFFGGILGLIVHRTR